MYTLIIGGRVPFLLADCTIKVATTILLCPLLRLSTWNLWTDNIVDCNQWGVVQRPQEASNSFYIYSFSLWPVRDFRLIILKLLPVFSEIFGSITLEASMHPAITLQKMFLSPCGLAAMTSWKHRMIDDSTLPHSLQPYSYNPSTLSRCGSLVSEGTTPNRRTVYN